MQNEQNKPPFSKTEIRCPSCQTAMVQSDIKTLPLKDDKSLPYRFCYECVKCGEKREINLLPLTSTLTRRDLQSVRAKVKYKEQF